jgi:hypothetical protein
MSILLPSKSILSPVILIAAENSSAADKKAAQYIYGSTTNKAITNAALTTLINTNISGGATAPFNGLTLNFANGNYFGMNLALTGRGAYNNPGKIKIQGNSGTFFSSSSTANVPVFTLSNAMQIEMENIRFKLNNSNLAIKSSVAPAYRHPIIGFTNTAGVLSAATIIDSGSGITGTIVADIVDHAGAGAGATLALTVTAGAVTAVSFTAGGTGYNSTYTKVYFRNGFTPTTGTARRACWNSSFKNLYFEGVGTHNNYACDFGSVFRSTFENIEIFNTNKGIKFEAQQSNFNPGNITFNRLFFDTGASSTANTIGLHIVSNGALSGQGRMNLMVFNETDFGTINGGEAIVFDGANLDGASDVTINIFNPEQFDTHFRVDCGNSIVVNHLSYEIQKPGATKPLIFFGRHAHNNLIDNFNLPLYFAGTATTIRMVSDNNTSAIVTNKFDKINTQTGQSNVTLSILNESGIAGSTKFYNFIPKIINLTTRLIDDALTSTWLNSALIPLKLKSPIPTYATNAAALADPALLLEQQYTVNTAGSKALFLK